MAKKGPNMSLTTTEIRKMQIKIILKFHLTPARMTETMTTNAGKDAPFSVDGVANRCRHSGNQYGGSSER